MKLFNLANYGESSVNDWIGKNAHSLTTDLSSKNMQKLHTDNAPEMIGLRTPFFRRGRKEGIDLTSIELWPDENYTSENHIRPIMLLYPSIVPKNLFQQGPVLSHLFYGKLSSSPLGELPWTRSTTSSTCPAGKLHHLDSPHFYTKAIWQQIYQGHFAVSACCKLPSSQRTSPPVSLPSLSSLWTLLFKQTPLSLLPQVKPLSTCLLLVSAPLRRQSLSS